jgi:hypothetical protein
VTGFDPELYLRQLGERLVVRDHRGVVRRRAEDLFEAACALVTCGVLDRELAWQVHDDYAAAFGVTPFRDRRGRPPVPSSDQPPAPPAAGLEPLSSRRIASTTLEIASQHGLGRLHLRWVILTASRVTVLLRTTLNSPAALGGLPPRVEVRTPHGQRIEAVFSGVIEPHLAGDFEGHGTIAAEVDWVTIDGTRVELDPTPPGVVVATRDLPPVDPATAFVWQLLADVNDGRGWPETGAFALGALRAAGVIADDDPELAAITWAMRHAPPAQRSGWTPQPTAVLTTPPATVPEQWRGLAATRARRFTGPTRTLAVGVVTPEFDGRMVAVDVLHSSPSGLTLEVEISGVDLDRSWEKLQRDPLAFWARDDHGNHYLGRCFGWVQEADGRAVGHGSVVFGPLDPEATELTVLAATATACATIEIPL